MKKITKLLIFIAMILLAISLNAQQNCGVVCHNGRLLTGVNPNAIERHVGHGDTFITTDCDYVETGNECAVLSLKKIDFSIKIENGLEYFIFDTLGRLRKEGHTEDGFYSSLPRQEYFVLRIETYNPTIYYLE